MANPQSVTSPKYFDPRTLARLASLRLRARHIVEGYVAGLHRSPLRGYSIEFSEHREYVPGDDLRHVDWKVFGRTDKFYVKQYEDETNLLCYLVVDGSESMMYSSTAASFSKWEYAQSLAAALAWLIVSQQDAVGMTIVDEGIRHQIPTASSAPHINQIIDALESHTPQRPTDLGKSLHELEQRLPRRGVVVVISDAFDDVDAMLAGLQRLRYRQHDVVFFHILDPAEIDFPFQRKTLFRGLEGIPSVVADARGIRKAYLDEFSGFLRAVERGCRARQIDYLRLNTQLQFDVPLSAFLTRRQASKQ